MKQLPRFDAVPTQLSACLWNIQSLRNKSLQLCDYIIEHDIDVMILTESWIRDDEHVIIGESTPPGYSFLNTPRPTGTRGGGIAVLFKTQLQLRVRTNPCNTTYFESTCITDNVGRLRGGFKTQPPVPSGSGRLSLFRTIETGRNRTEPPVYRRLGFEAVP